MYIYPIWYIQYGILFCIFISNISYQIIKFHLLKNDILYIILNATRPNKTTPPFSSGQNLNARVTVSGPGDSAQLASSQSPPKHLGFHYPYQKMSQDSYDWYWCIFWWFCLVLGILFVEEVLVLRIKDGWGWVVWADVLGCSMHLPP